MWLGKNGSSPHTNPELTGSFALHPQVIKNNLNPTWKRFSGPLQHFCGGDPSTPMEVRSLPPEWIE